VTIPGEVCFTRQDVATNPELTRHILLFALLSGNAMTLRVLAVSMLAASLFPSATGAEDKAVWLRDLDAAKEEANTSHRDILIVFTGKGWCYPCQLLEREVLTQPAFERRVRGDYVLVELDFTFGDTKEEKVREFRLRNLQDRYLARGVPTVVLADAHGVPYAIQTGYASGIGVTPSLLMIKLARTARTLRDRHFRLAAATTGKERAEYLHQGIIAVARLLGSLEDRGDDPVLVFYKPQVEEIRKADGAGTGKVWDRYEARRKERDQWVSREAVFSRLKEFDAKNYRGAIAYLDEQIKKPGDRDLHWRLERTRQVYLEWDEQHEKALANARRLLQGVDLSEKDRDWLRDREADNLKNLGRIDELLSHFDRRIAAARGDTRKSLTLLHEKAQWISYFDRPEQAQAAWRGYRAAVAPGSEDWLNATQGLAEQLRKAGQHRAAIELLEEGLKVKEWEGLLLDAAESHIALGEKDRAQACLNKVEAAARSLEGSHNQLDTRTFAAIQRRLKALRAQCDRQQAR
jgi:thioredoxin-related protein/tetratricopeptide (TPR) repeat protein